MDELKKKLEQHAEENGLALSSNAERIIAKIHKLGCCPCRIKFTQCPCSYHLDEVKDLGRCHCGLFLRKSDA